MAMSDFCDQVMKQKSAEQLHGEGRADLDESYNPSAEEAPTHQTGKLTDHYGNFVGKTSVQCCVRHRLYAMIVWVVLRLKQSVQGSLRHTLSCYPEHANALSCIAFV